jgi:2-methylcitrate dehydratase PrpD
MTNMNRRVFLRTSGGLGLSPFAPQNSNSTDPAGDEVTKKLAHYIVSAQSADLSAPVRKEAARTLLNWVGCTVGGSRHETVGAAVSALAPFSGPAQASILGRKERLDILNTALINGISSHVLDYDDTHLPTVVHPTGPAMSAALAVGEWKRASGKELIAAFAVGFEVECRVGMAVHPEHYDAGWHITGTAGTFGGAAAAGRLLGLDPRRMSWALGMAGSQAAGVREQFGTMSKSLHIGKAAANGLLGAVLASHSFDATEQIFEGRRGFSTVLSTGQHLERLTDGLGERWQFAANGVKPYACGVVTHPIIDAVRRMRERERLTADQVQAIEARVHPLVLELTGKREPRVGLEGKFSVYHCAAIALIEGHARPGQFSDEAVNRPDAVGLRRKVSATADPALAEHQTEVAITLTDGRRLTEWVEAATGSPQNPISDEELRGKVHDLIWPFVPRWKEDRLLELIDGLEALPDVGAFAELLAPPEGGEGEEPR